jgi:hypothetical protein
VACSDDDTVRVVDTAARKIIRSIKLGQPADPEFGQMPTSLALSDDERTLYVACGGSNSVAVIGLPGGEIRGHIPAGWFPIAVCQRQGVLFVASSKGLGSRTPGRKPGDRDYSSTGTVQFITPAAMSNLGALSTQVPRNDRWAGSELPARPGQKAVPVPERVGEPSVFKHVVYIIKENHTYDLDLGDMPEGNGDKSLCVFDESVTPNEHALARQFVLLDNTYTSGTNSADGHQWVDSALANAYMEQNYGNYVRSYPFDGGDPLAYSPKGFLWTSAIAHGKTVRVYGEFVNKPRIIDPKTGRGGNWRDRWADYKAGAHRFQITAHTDNAALKPLLHPNYIGFPLTVSDQWRADQFLADLKQFEANDNMPSLCMLELPCNHTEGTTPGEPAPRAHVADNDLALGRIVQGISHSSFWKDTLILVIEDDSQFGLDHVDGHRTLCFCISAYTRRHAVIHDFYAHTSVVRTIELVLGMPAMNQFDLTATPMTDCFMSKPDLTPYAHVPNTVPLDELSPMKTALRGTLRRLAEASSKQDFSAPDRANPLVMARAVWAAQRPGVPFPWAEFRKGDAPDSND